MKLLEAIKGDFFRMDGKIYRLTRINYVLCGCVKVTNSLWLLNCDGGLGVLVTAKKARHIDIEPMELRPKAVQA